MRGSVLDFDPRSGSGIISGGDGVRYTFKGVDVQNNFEKIRAGVNVDFEAVEDQATAIYPVAPSAGQVGEKSKVAAGLLALFLGGLGIHKFYLGQTTAGIIMLLVSVLGAILLFIPTFIVGIIAFIEGIIYLTKSDEDFYQTYEVGKKAWF
ncbi:TM2 domain-containing protein [Paracoccus denitrificans]|jgi:TM2 domain-containing membrane protein YozV/cold shock CspA family protein|uniref:TM2 domain-containing protein n=1 Tax=Paracoccus denitrificans TaxID=266 RepID=UPI003364FCDE